MVKLRKMTKNKLGQIVKEANIQMSKNVRDVKLLETEQILSYYQQTEFMRTVNMVKDVDFADFNTLKTFYLFRLKDELDQILLADDVEKEFRTRVRLK